MVTIKYKIKLLLLSVTYFPLIIIYLPSRKYVGDVEWLFKRCNTDNVWGFDVHHLKNHFSVAATKILLSQTTTKKLGNRIIEKSSRSIDELPSATNPWTLGTSTIGASRSRRTCSDSSPSSRGYHLGEWPDRSPRQTSPTLANHTSSPTKKVCGEMRLWQSRWLITIIARVRMCLTRG